MYKVIIADDEPMIRDGLSTLLDWEGLGYEVIDTAMNGKEALQKFGEQRPDLLILDIRMPGLTGLEVVEQLRQTGKHVHVLILSGYADFEYARKAIVYQVDGYLLKPVDEDELQAHLLQLKEKLDRERSARDMASAMGDWTREMVIQSFLPGGGKTAGSFGEAEIAQANLVWESYDLLLVKLLGRDGEIEPEQAAQIKRQLAVLIEDTGRGAVFSLEPYIGLLLKERLGNDQARRSLYKELASLIGQQDIAFAAAAGDPVRLLPDIGRCYEEAARLLHMRFFYEGDRIIMPDAEPVAAAADAPADEQALTAELTAAADKLFFAIDIGNFESVAQLVSDCGRRLIGAGCSEQEIKSHFARIVTAVLGKLAQGDAEIQSRSEQFSSGIIDIYKQSPYSALERHVIRFLHGFIHGAANGGTDKQIKKMIDLIHRNYQENLKLDALADVFNYNSAYLGKLFKTTTGEYFNTYLDKVRIEKAKEFLAQGMKVYQVAEKVGYTNVDYFHSKFRKYVGSSPSSYRKMH